MKSSTVGTTVFTDETGKELGGEASEGTQEKKGLLFVARSCSGLGVCKRKALRVPAKCCLGPREPRGVGRRGG